MSYSTRAEVRDMVKDDALNAIIGDTFIEDPAEREELVSPIIDAAIADADAEIVRWLTQGLFDSEYILLFGKLAGGTPFSDPKAYDLMLVVRERPVYDWV